MNALVSVPRAYQLRQLATLYGLDHLGLSRRSDGSWVLVGELRTGREELTLTEREVWQASPLVELWAISVEGIASKLRPTHQAAVRGVRDSARSLLTTGSWS